MKVLVAEDDKTSRKLISLMLTKWGFDAVIAKDGREAWDILQQDNHPQLLILDWMMPYLDGAQICRKIRENGRQGECYPYVILLTARSSKEHIVEGLEAGADDYVTKPYDAKELRVRIRAGQRIIHQQNKLMELKKKLEELAATDSLTRTANRMSSLNRLAQEMEREARSGNPLSIAMMDLDHFKHVNDTHGHVVGDRVLAECADRVRRALRKYDVLGRYGGEEFLLIFPDTALHDAAMVCDRIRDEIDCNPFIFEDCEIKLTISFGVAAYEEGMNIEKLVCAADDALYRAKEWGRNKVVSAEGENRKITAAQT